MKNGVIYKKWKINSRDYYNDYQQATTINKQTSNQAINDGKEQSESAARVD
jgi:hypothetical protein